MFEIILVLCLIGTPDSCQQQLLTGGATSQRQKCQDSVNAMRDNVTKRFGVSRYVQSMDCVQRKKSSLLFNEVAEGLFVHQGNIENPNTKNFGDISNTGFIIGSESILVIDSGGSYRVGEELYWAIRERSGLPVRYLALTHMHPDHVFGASVFSGLETRIIGHKNLAQALAERIAIYKDNYASQLGMHNALGVRLPHIDMEVAVGSPMEVDLGNRLVRLDAWPTAHSNNDLSVYDAQSSILFAGDLLFDRHTPVIDGDIRGWQKVMAEIGKRNDIVSMVPGHGEPLLPAATAFFSQTRYFNQLVIDSQEAIEKGERMMSAVTHIGEDERDKWLLFDDFNPRNASVVFSQLEWE